MLHPLRIKKTVMESGEAGLTLMEAVEPQPLPLKSTKFNNNPLKINLIPSTKHLPSNNNHKHKLLKVAY
ncbi:hypothetical protein D3C86_2234210 [compost metagenome]